MPNRPLLVGALAFCALSSMAAGAISGVLFAKAQTLTGAEADQSPDTWQPRVFIDPLTGCHYLLDRQSMQARLHSDGAQVCEEDAEEDEQDGPIIGFHEDEQGNRVYDEPEPKRLVL